MIEKRGLTPVIATALLITLVVILSSVVFLWARGFIQEQIAKFDQPIELLCERVEWSIDVVNSGSSIIIEANNRGNVPIFGFTARKINNSQGTEEKSQYSLSLSTGEAKELSVDLKFENGESPDEVIFYPSLLGRVVGDNETIKAKSCLTNGKRYVF